MKTITNVGSTKGFKIEILHHKNQDQFAVLHCIRKLGSHGRSWIRAHSASHKQGGSLQRVKVSMNIYQIINSEVLSSKKNCI